MTIDCNESLALRVGDTIYTNLYRPMFLLLRDDAGQNDLIHPSCRKEMFDFFYHDGEGHPNCLDNLNGALGTNHPILQPVNLFMNTRILPDGRIRVEAPASKAGGLHRAAGADGRARGPCRVQRVRERVQRRALHAPGHDPGGRVKLRAAERKAARRTVFVLRAASFRTG